MRDIADLTWTGVRQAAAAGAVAVVPTGSLEQHGWHLPVRTDSTLVDAVCARALDLLPEGMAVRTPTLWLGASHHHLPFFAASVPESTYIEVISGLGGSLASAGFGRILFLNGHGGNAAPLRVAINAISRRWPAVLVAATEYWAVGAAGLRQARATGPGGAAHAGEVETALMLAIAPGAVDLARARPDIPHLPGPLVRDLTDGGPVTLAVPWESLSASGALGDPTRATAEAGAAMLAACARAVAEAITALAGLQMGQGGPQPAGPV